MVSVSDVSGGRAIMQLDWNAASRAERNPNISRVATREGWAVGVDCFGGLGS